MIAIDWTALMLGLAAGAVASAAFFAGLAFGMRLALRTASSVRVLILSAALRMAILLGLGWLVVGQGGPWAGLGFALAFFAARLIATTLARTGADARGAS